MSAQNNHNQRRFLVRWVGFSALALFFGLIFSFTLALFVASFLGDIINKSIANAIGYSILGGGTGALVGLAQWKMVRKKIDISAKWILTCAGGLAIAELIAGLALMIIGSDRDLVQESQNILIYTLIYTFGGALVGLLQHSEFEKFSSKSILWIYACSLSWGATMMILQIGFSMNKPIPVLIAFLLGLFALGLITGFFLIRIIGTDKLSSSKINS